MVKKISVERRIALVQKYSTEEIAAIQAAGAVKNFSEIKRLLGKPKLKNSSALAQVRLINQAVNDIVQPNNLVKRVYQQKKLPTPSFSNLDQIAGYMKPSRVIERQRRIEELRKQVEERRKREEEERLREEEERLREEEDRRDEEEYDGPTSWDDFSITQPIRDYIRKLFPRNNRVIFFEKEKPGKFIYTSNKEQSLSEFIEGLKSSTKYQYQDALQVLKEEYGVERIRMNFQYAPSSDLGNEQLNKPKWMSSKNSIPDFFKLDVLEMLDRFEKWVNNRDFDNPSLETSEDIVETMIQFRSAKVLPKIVKVSITVMGNTWSLVKSATFQSNIDFF